MGELKRVKELFAGRHFAREVIILCVRWYLRYKLSFRDLVDVMAERGLSLSHHHTKAALSRRELMQQSHSYAQGRRCHHDVDTHPDSVCGIQSEPE